MRRWAGKPFDRRAFIKASAGAAAATQLPALHFTTAYAQTDAEKTKLGSWDELYRQRWTWDHIAKGSHGWLNCRSACNWDLYVKNGIVVREEQTAQYEASEPGVPDFNPRGCQKGACYSEVMYGPSRIMSPMKRVGERGSGQWQKISWDQALEEIADKLVTIAKTHGNDSVVQDMGPHFDFGATTAGRCRFFALFGASLPDDWAEIGDLNLGATLTFGFPHIGGSSDEWFLSDFLVVWMMNPAVTQMPDAHFLFEAKYNGSTLTVIDPQYSATAVHADHWIPIESGSDAALALYTARYIWENGHMDEAYVKEQTDLPILVRLDNGRFLMESDIEEDGRSNAVYFWDKNSNTLTLAFGSEGVTNDTRLELGKHDPAIEGQYDITLHSGEKIAVATVGSLLKEQLGQWTLQHTADVTKLSQQHIQQFAKGFAKAKRPMVLSSWGSNRFFHSDLMNRAKILCLSLKGAIGRKGSGYHSTGWVGFDGFGMAGTLEDTSVSSILQLLYRLHGADGLFDMTVDLITKRKTMQEFHRDTAKAALTHPESCSTNSASLNYKYQGIKEDLNREQENLGYARSLDEYIEEAQAKNWMPVPEPKNIKAWITGGNNVLRRTNLPQRMLENLWPQLDLVVDVNQKLTFTGMHADYLLPAAGYYEKLGFKYTVAYVPYLHFCDAAVAPLGESKDEWEIYHLLADKIQKIARDNNMEPLETCAGRKVDFQNIAETYSFDRDYGPKDIEKVTQLILENSSAAEGVTLEQLRKDGIAKFTSPGHTEAQSQIYNSEWKGEGVLTTLTHFTEKKYRWPTLTGRQQFYIDHPWFIEAGESLPTHKPSPKAGGDYPLQMVSCHSRWSVHSVWRDTPLLLRLQRGEPALYLNPKDAKKRNLEDGGWGQVKNDYGTIRMRIKYSNMVRPSVAYYFHAWEPFQFPDHKSYKWITPGLMKPLHFAGDHGQISWQFGVWEPGTAVQDTRIDITPWTESEESA